MKKAVFVLSLLLAALLSLGVYATQSLLVDNASLLTDEESEYLRIYLEELSEKLEADIVILTEDSISGYTPKEYADTFYDTNAYGYGGRDDGVLLLISMEDRDYYISTCGRCEYHLEYRISAISDAFLSTLSVGDYLEAFITFADEVSYYITLGDEEGFTSPDGDYNDDYFEGMDYPENNYYFDNYYYNNDYYYSTATPFFNDAGSIIFCVIVGFIISLIVMLVIKSGMKTVRPQNHAKNYISPGSLSLRSAREVFLYRNVTKTPRNTGSSSNRPSGGHFGGISSSIGRSGGRSGGSRSHGGGGGKF